MKGKPPHNSFDDVPREPIEAAVEETVDHERKGTRFTGTEPIFGGFTNSSTIISNIRLTHKGQIFVPTVDLAAAIVTLAREYRFHGDAIRAYQAVIRIRSNFESRIQSWRNEEMSRLQAKRSMNGNQIRDLEKELNRVRLEISRGESTLNRLQNDLDLISRVGDDCPLLKPQTGEMKVPDDEYVVPAIKKKNTSDKALLSLNGFVKPNGLNLKFADARFRDDFDTAIREHVYDQKTHLSIIAHWSDRNPQTRERGNIYLRLLLVPKSIDALVTLPDVIKRHDFLIQAGSWNDRIQFDSMGIGDEKTIVEKRIMDYLYDIEAKAFQHRDLIVKKTFEFYAGDILPDISFQEGTGLDFQMSIVARTVS